jgi:hypothetical protein
MTFLDFGRTPMGTNEAGTSPAHDPNRDAPNGFGFDFNGLFYATGAGNSADAILTYTVRTTDGANTIDKATLLALGTDTTYQGITEAVCAVTLPGLVKTLETQTTGPTTLILRETFDPLSNDSVPVPTTSYRPLIAPVRRAAPAALRH